MTLSMYFVEISVNISADVFVEKTYGKLVNQTLIFTSLPFIKLIVFTVTAQVHHKVISVDLVEFDIIWDSLICIHISSISKSIDIAEWHSSAQDVYFELRNWLLIEKWTVLLLEILSCVYVQS